MLIRNYYALLLEVLPRKYLSCQPRLPPLLLRRVGRLERRSIFSRTGRWEKDYSPAVAKEIESYWSELTTQGRTNVGEVEREKFYVLSMFPYPSGRLHMGHVRVYTISDAMARYHTMKGKQVIHPMGWDAFGLPAENAAIERGEAPERWTYSNISHMRKQLKELGCNFDWNREFATCDPSYYKWTQYIFLQMFEAGLAYQKEASVNWDPVDGTVLADEQIDEEGRSWRSGACVEKKYLRQWYLRTTAYAKALSDGLKDVDESMWRDVTKLQKHWLGHCDGTRFDFTLQCDGKNMKDSISVFTNSPEAIFGATFIALSPEHRLNKKLYYQTNGNKDGENNVLRIQAVNPFNQEKVPVVVCPSLIYEEKNDSYLGIACVKEEDDMLAKSLGFDVVNVIDLSGGETTLVNSGEFSGLSRAAAAEGIMQYARAHKIGGYWVSSKLNDWLISRQRYWGTPIPIIHCPSCKAVAVSYSDLPVKLPELTSSYTVSPLLGATEWKHTTCPRCGEPAERETDTMDTFVDSSWYFLRYLDPHNETRPFDSDTINKYMPVDLYIGGKEHAVLHLYFARFFCHFLHEQGWMSEKEPFKGLLTQGMVMGQSYRVKGTGRYLPTECVQLDGKTATEKETGSPVVVRWEKMSKSKHNGVDPQDVLDELGTDTTRLCILSNVAPKSDRHWSSQAFVGILRWQKKLWTILCDYIQHHQHCDTSSTPPPPGLEELETNLFDTRNYHLKHVNFHLKETYNLNVVISKLQSYTGDLRNKKYTAAVMTHSKQFEQTLADHIILLAPFAPCFASEMWAGLTSVPSKTNKYQWDKGVLEQDWPEVDQRYKLPLRMMVNGQLSEQINLPREELERLTLETAHNLAKLTPNYQKYVVPCVIGGTELEIIRECSATLKIELPEKRPKQMNTEES